MPCHQEIAKSCVPSQKGPPVPVSEPPLLKGYLQSSKTALSPLLNTPLLEKPVGKERCFPWIKIRLASNKSREDLGLSCPGLSTIFHPRGDVCVGQRRLMKHLKDSLA